jgi:transglutaminase-like putative cysteine protease
VPVPMDWPEQRVTEVAREVSANVGAVTFRVVSGGVKQMVIQIPQLAAGDKATAVVTFEIAKTQPQGPPAERSGLSAPDKPKPEFKKLYLGVSPLIETTHPEIRRLSEELVAGRTSDWDKAEAIYDGVRARVKYKFDPELKGALTALRKGVGDCEELTSLFVAACRVQKIPARSVWVPGHCYPEFYLEQDGQGTWFACQAAGARDFGQVHEAKPILQKGDNFQVPGETRPKRYVAQTFQAKNATASPRIRWVDEQVAE